jgi:hypothetical protein
VVRVGELVGGVCLCARGSARAAVGVGWPVVDIPDGFEEIAPRPVVRSTLGGVIAVGLAFAAVARLAGDPVRTYLVIVVVVLVRSLWSPPALVSGAKSTLAAMQVVTAAICAGVLTRSVRPSSH